MKSMSIIVKKDVIKIIDKDILNAMAFTLYRKKYKEVIEENRLEYKNVCDELIEALENPKLLKYSIFGISIDSITLACAKINNFKSSMYITDTFLVTETYNEYFKVGLLCEYDEEEFKRVGKLKEILNFLYGLLFPYNWEYDKFYKLTCTH